MYERNDEDKGMILQVMIVQVSIRGLCRFHLQRPCMVINTYISVAASKGKRSGVESKCPNMQRNESPI